MQNSILLNKVNKRRVLMLFQILISVTLISYLIYIVEWDRAFKILRASNIIYLIVGFSLWILGLFFASLRWHIVLKDNNISFSIFESYKAYLRGMFYNIFLPGVIGGDVVRIGICRFQTECGLGKASVSVLLERISGVFSLFVYLFLSYSIFFDEFSDVLNFEFIKYLLILGLLFTLLFMISIFFRFKLIDWLSSKDDNKFLKILLTGVKAFCSVNLRTLLIVLILSSLFQGVDIFACFLFSRAIGIELSLPILFGIVPLVYFATILPVSLGGLGVRESTFAFLLTKFGVTSTDAITLSFLIYFNRVIYGLSGGIVGFVDHLRMKNTINFLRLSVKE